MAGILWQRLHVALLHAVQTTRIPLVCWVDLRNGAGIRSAFRPKHTNVPEYGLISWLHWSPNLYPCKTLPRFSQHISISAAQHHSRPHTLPSVDGGASIHTEERDTAQWCND